ncbi:MAG: Nif3-like dinuclear metal center hexameric protein [Candidatus Promineifilaceae bacterium]
MQAKEVQTYLQSMAGDWPYPTDTVDTFKAGDPTVEITGIAVGWMSYSWALEEAVRKNCNLFITHEPTLYDHHDKNPDVFRFEAANKKRHYIAEHGLVVLRCHDLWDRIPEIGIPDSWGAYLGFQNAVHGDDYIRIFDVGKKSALEIAQGVSAVLRQLGHERVQLIGPSDKQVRFVATGTGAITPFMRCLDEFQADMVICTDDGLWYWRDGALAIDAGVPLLVVNHAVSEEAGMVSLANHLRQIFPSIPIHHLPQRCMYQLV